MRNPVRSETDAFYITYGGGALIAVSVALGVLVDPLVGVALLAGGLCGALLWEVATEDPERRRSLREAATDGRRRATTTRRRVLVVANRTLHGEGLRERLREAGAAGAEVHVVAPILPSRVHYVASDVDRELEEARERLRAALAWAREEGVDASGKVGDPFVALGVIEDELREFAADEVIVSTLPPGKSNWLEAGILERLNDELEIPVTHVVVDDNAMTLSA
jgi:hypothetical protein